MSRTELGICLGIDGLVACDMATGTVVRRTLIPYNGDHTWPSLTEAVESVAGGRRIAIALATPLAEVRQLALPPLPDADLVLLLQRNAANYFAAARGPQVVTVLTDRPSRGAPATVLAAAVPAALLAAVRSAARDAGVTVATISCVEAAWIAAARTDQPAVRRGRTALFVTESNRVTLLGLDGGKWTSLRRFRGGVAGIDLATESIGDATRVVIAGAGATAFAGTLARTAAALMPLDGEPADVFAARGATQVVAPIWRSDDAVQTERSQLRRATIAMSAAAVALIVIAAALQLWGVRRALRTAEADRAALRPQVAATLVGRSSVDDAYRRTAAVIAAERASPRWSAVFADLTSRIPDDAYLTTLRIRGDTVTIDGIATSAARVFDAVVVSPLLRGVRAPAPVRRLSPEGGEPTERFTLLAQLSDSAHAVPGVRR